MTQALEIKSIVVGGCTEPTDDHWTETAIVRLESAFLVEVV